MKIFAWLAAVAVFAQAPPSGSWQLQYFYDKDDSSLVLIDLKFFDRNRGMAAGYIEEKSKGKPSALITADGGVTWKLEPLKEPPRSLFVLDDSHAWMVTDKGVWKTDEAGRSWRKIARREGLLRVHFLDAQRGWGVGAPKQFLQTTDGGRTWNPVRVQAEAKTTPEFTAYTFIDFSDGANGIVTGWSAPPRWRSRLPSWMEPDIASRRRQLPTLSLMLSTADGGKTWNGSSTSAFGRIVCLRASDRPPLLLVEYQDAFDWPAEVMVVDARAGRNASVFRQRDRAVTDVAGIQGVAYLAAIEPAGQVRSSPIPGRLHVLTSRDLKTWEEAEVDYRAVGARAFLARMGGDLWVATDTGMILKRTP
ncbi:MAG: WD40/YVTN/BNR-like repeat-containing protein [Bryobacteraceae bacterium]